MREVRLGQSRAVQVELTRAGHALQGRLLKAVISFNQRLRAGIGGEDEGILRGLLLQMQDNVGERPDSRLPERSSSPR